MATALRQQIFATILLLSTIVYARNTRFEKFFGIYNEQLTLIRDVQCKDEWAKERAPHAVYDDVCYTMLECMLQNTPEYLKSNFSSGVVALGLLPTILTFLSSSPGETALLSRRRPLLAALLAIGCPSVNPIPTFVYEDPVGNLQARDGKLMPRWLSGPWGKVVCLLQYILVCGAVVNVLWTSYDASLRTINAMACATTYFTVLWAGLTIVIHLIGVICLNLRYTTVRDNSWADERSSGGFPRWVRHEFSPCISHEKLVLEKKPETYWFVIMSWFGSIGTVSHLLFGTLSFSSFQFIGSVDATLVIVKYMVSAAVCRVTLMSELAGMRNAMQTHNRIDLDYGHSMPPGSELAYVRVDSNQSDEGARPRKGLGTSTLTAVYDPARNAFPLGS